MVDIKPATQEDLAGFGQANTNRGQQFLSSVQQQADQQYDQQLVQDWVKQQQSGPRKRLSFERTGPVSPPPPTAPAPSPIDPSERVDLSGAPAGSRGPTGGALRYQTSREIALAKARGEITGPQALEQYRMLQALQQTSQGARYVRVGKEEPAHAEPVGWTIQQRPGPSEETREALDQATQERAKAETAVAQAEQNTAAAESTRLAREALAARRDVDDEKARRAEVDARLSSLMKEQDSAISAVRSGEVNPDRYTESKGWGGKVVAAIGMVLSALAGPEYLRVAKDELNKRINEDIDAQKTRLQTLRDTAALKRSQLGQAIEMYGSPAAGELAIRERAIASVQARARAMQARTKTKEASARLSALIASLEEDRLKARADLETATGAAVTSQVQWVPEQQSRVVAVGGAKPEDVDKTFESMGKNGESASGPNPLTVPGKGIAFDPTSAGKMRDWTVAHGTADELLGEAIAMASENRVWGDPENARAEQIKIQGVLALKNLYEMGALDKGALEVGQQIFADPNTWRKPAARAKFEGLRKDLQSRDKFMTRAYIADPQ